MHLVIKLGMDLVILMYYRGPANYLRFNEKYMATSYAKWTLADLRKEQARIEKAIASKEGKERKAVLARVTSLAKKHGFSLDELTDEDSTAAPAQRRKAPKAKKSALKGAKVPPKYRSKTDKSLTWTGRGRTPVWVQEYENAGGKRDDLLIKRK